MSEQVSVMNSMKVLLGLTFTLLIAALGFAYTQGGKNNLHPALINEVETLRADHKSLTERIIRLEAQLDLLTRSGGVGVIPHRPHIEPAPRVVPPLPKSSPQDDEASRLAREEAGKVLQDEQELIKKEILDAKMPQANLEKEILSKDAVGKITKWDPDYWILSIAPFGQTGLKAGEIMSVRRNGNIIGSVRITEVLADSIAAEPSTPYTKDIPIPEFQEGDEIVFPSK